MGQIKYMAGLLLTVLFAVAIIGYMIDFGNDNNADVRLSNDSDIVYIQTGLEGNTTNFANESDDSFQAFFQSEIGFGDETTNKGGQFKGGVVSSYNAIKNIISATKDKIFGYDPRNPNEEGNSSKVIFLTALITFLGVQLYLLIWKTWKSGNPE